MPGYFPAYLASIVPNLNALYYFEHIDLIDVEKIRKENQKFSSWWHFNGVGSATCVDAGATLGLGVDDLSGLQPDLACNERVVRDKVSAVIASRVEGTAEVRSPSDDKV